MEDKTAGKEDRRSSSHEPVPRSIVVYACPCRWRELPDLGDLGRGQAGEQAFQVIKRVDPASSATARQRVNHRTAFPGLRIRRTVSHCLINSLESRSRFSGKSSTMRMLIVGAVDVAFVKTVSIAGGKELCLAVVARLLNCS